jgi:FlaA1/EpsC-like NDP-sugar epimerase
MGVNLFKIPRWVILVIDLFIVFTGISCAYLLRFNFNIPPVEILVLPLSLLTVLLIRGLSFVIAKTFQGVIRYTSSDDILRITSVVAIGSGLILLSNLVNYQFKGQYLVPTSVVFIEFFCTLFFLIIPRLLIKLLYHEYKYKSKPKWDVIIYGAGELAVITKRTLDRDRATKYNIIGFIGETNKKIHATIEGIQVYHYKDLDNLLEENNVSHLIISSSNLENSRKQEMVEKCLEKSITIRHVPPVEKWINGELSFNQIKHVKIEDLLGRDEISISLDKISSVIKNKTVLVTGAAGSIGSELSKQILKFSPHRVILYDQAESGLFDLNIELENQFSNRLWNLVVGDIKNSLRLRTIFEQYKPQIVFHAAAYKHVPLMEDNVSEAVSTNIYGTKNLADLSVEYGVEKFILVSTDKAVNPTNIMGASKRSAEIYIQSLNKITDTSFITTRFGNVLGSNGSVIPLFKKQIQRGGPITVTHPDVTRYFMTIPEACKLVLEAGSTGKGGEIFVFDMGESVKIIDLAKKMIRLSGLTIGKDIEIKFTGLRPGEKLHEELLNEKEHLLPTHHPKILIGKVREYDFEHIKNKIIELIDLAQNQAAQDILARKIKELVPEYVSQNAEFTLVEA